MDDAQLCPKGLRGAIRSPRGPILTTLIIEGSHGTDIGPTTISTMEFYA